MKKLLFALALVLLFSNTAFAQRMYDGSGRQIGRVDGERYYDGSGHQIGRVDGTNIYDGCRFTLTLSLLRLNVTLDHLLRSLDCCLFSIGLTRILSR